MAGLYPDRDRALRHLRRTQAVYLYGRCPQRVVLGLDQPLSDFDPRFDTRRIFLLPPESETHVAGS